ncbi:hypothetical protein QBC38DRAFT_492530 [Podospora fimiseda]|uniref:C2H2-type domain-containing protein n=1 Tax=Podospora fimiseda TaxID=252190 RepID=A0AAN6YL03_9PEZI|nr:hypothetical protein QBC38DRAFT_492530 [Podospora fimiseda]
MSNTIHNQSHWVDLCVKIHTLSRNSPIQTCPGPDKSIDGGPVRTFSQDSVLGDDEYPIHGQKQHFAAGGFGEVSEDDYDDLRNGYVDESWTSSFCSSTMGTPEHCSDNDIVIVPKVVNTTTSSPKLHDHQPLKCIVHEANPRGNPKCTKQEFKSIFALKTHILDCHQRPDYCPRCGATFARSAHWSRHIIARNCNAKVNALDGVPGVHGDIIDRIMEWEPDRSVSEESNLNTLRGLLNSGY